MRRLHPVFNVIKLTPAPLDPIIGRHWIPLPPPKLIDSKEEYIVEEILDSRMFWRKLQYLVKWEGYGIENNSWEYWDNLCYRSGSRFPHEAPRSTALPPLE